MKPIQRIRFLALTIVLFICTFLSVALDLKAEQRVDRVVDYPSSMATWEVQVEGNNLVIHNYDKRRTSSTAYRTIGFTISRCKRNVTLDQNNPTAMLSNGTATEWIALPVYEDAVSEEPEYVLCSDGVVVDHTKWSFPITEMINKMRSEGYYDWADEVQGAFIDKTITDTVWLKFDSIMVVTYYTEANPEGVQQGTYGFSLKRTIEGTCYTNTPLQSNAPENPDALIRAKSWSAKAIPKIKYHYNRFFSSNDTITPTPPPTDPDSNPYFGSARSVYETKNYSSEFDISKAIPAGEDVTNMVSASSFNGTVSISEKTESKDYTITRTYYTTTSGEKKLQKKYVYVGGWIDAYGDWHGNGNYYHSPIPGVGLVLVGWGNGDWIIDYVWETEEGEVETVLATVTYKFRATAYFDTLDTCNIGALESVTVYNNAYPGGQIQYSKYASGPLCLTKTNVSLEVAKHGSNRSTFTDITAIEASKKIYVESASDLETAKATERKAIIDKIGGGISTYNDKLVVIDNTIRQEFMMDTPVGGGVVTDLNNTSLTYSYGTKASASNKAYGLMANGTVDNFINNLRPKRNQACVTVTIPSDTQNLDFPTGIKAVYRNLTDNSVMEYAAGNNFFAGSDSIYAHVMNGGVLSKHNGGDPDDGYPIRVHTPIVAPIKIVFSDLTPAIEKTQLVTEKINTTANYQLLLDRQYYIEWDNENWVSSLYGANLQGYENVFDKYVQKKMVRFPFTVVYEGITYETNASGYTPWILVKAPSSYDIPWNVGLSNTDIEAYKSNNHWQMTPFYIPSFAEDCGWAGVDKFVEVAVYAKNFTSTDLSNDDASSVNLVTQNTLTSQYIATTKRQVQLSGWIYDFSVVGTTNNAMYTGNGLDAKDIFTKNLPFSFAKIRSELKVGTKNRLGTPNIRALADGMYFPSPLDLKQQIPLRNGASLAFSNLGEVWLGQPFAFTLKTMGSLNGKNDSIHIEPSFRYITENGEVLDSKNGEMKMYVVTDNGKTMDIREFDPTDTSLYRPNSISLNDGMFEESFYDGTDSFVGPTGHYLQVGNWATNTANQENALNAAAGYFGSSVSAADIMSRKTYSYNLNHIKIPSTLRYMAGEYEQLQMNDGKMYDRNTSTNTLLTYWDTISNYTTTTETKFINSIQQWQSAYVVPTNIYIVDTRTVGGAAFDIMDYIENQTQFSWSTDPIVESKNGKLIIGFDILAYKNGVPYLTYGGGGNNMWLTEEPSVKEGIEPPIPPVPPVPPIIPDETEVVVVNMSKKITDYVEPGIQNIN